MDLEKEKKRQALEKERLNREAELVNHPAHYLKDGKECIDVMQEKFGLIATMHFCILNAFKYRFRAGSKAGNPVTQDEAKAVWYDRKAVEILNLLLTSNTTTLD